ncbi:hypothetical protein [Maritimibacter sp. 55A14]|uniref:hypothetical protein n=1 Tax=Maritimibacter sp. 55A14 TaxID=2174844 RepID=UPI0011B1FE7A|nr:hypothetical protein [Maritimibacter sp. 55A14]
MIDVNGVLLSVGVAAFLDTLFLTGYFTYGGAIVAAATAAYVASMSATSVWVAASAGVFVAESVNMLIASFAKKTRLVSDKIDTLTLTQNKFGRVAQRFLHNQDDSFLASVLKTVVLRFIPLTRPINTLILGTVSGTHPKNFLAVAISTVLWVTFWVILFEKILTASSTLIERLN